jgi:hypothetical protein
VGKKKEKDTIKESKKDDLKKPKKKSKKSVPVEQVDDADVELSSVTIPKEEDEIDLIDEVNSEMSRETLLEYQSEYAYMMSILRSLISSREASQKLRIQMGNRICMNIITKLGVRAGESPSEALKKAAIVQRNNMLKACIRVTDQMLTPTRRKVINELQKDKGLFSNVFEASLIQSYYDMLRAEKEHNSLIEKAVMDIPIIRDYLSKIDGCGAFLAGYIVCNMDPHAAPRPSSFWKYTGLDVVVDENGVGVGRSSKRCHMIKVEYINKEGEEAVKDSLTYKPPLKSKLTKVLGECLIKANGKYKKIFDGYKHRMLQRKNIPNPTAGHIYKMSVRYMVKMFLADLWRAWRIMEGLEVVPTYAEAKLGLVHREDTSRASVS